MINTNNLNKNLFVNVQQSGLGNNVVTTSAGGQIINPFANVFINHQGIVTAGTLDQRGQGQGTLIPTTFGNGQGGFPVILPSLLTVVDGNGAAKLPVPAIKPAKVGGGSGQDGECRNNIYD